MALSPADVLDIKAERQPIDYYGRVASYVDTVKMQAWKGRIRKLNDIVDNNWPNVFPEFEKSPTVGNLVGNSIKADLTDVALLAGTPKPSVVVDPEDRDKDSDEKRAAKLQRILLGYWYANDFDVLRPWLAGDLAGTGMCCLVVYPDQDSGAPLYIRKDPMYVYPDRSYKGLNKIDDLMYVYREKLRIVEEEYPGTTAELLRTREVAAKALPDEVEVIEFYDKTECVKIAGVQLDKKNRRAALLASFRHDLGKSLAVIGMRPSFDGQFRGQFDDSIGPLGVKNEIMNLQLQGIGREVWPIIHAWGDAIKEGESIGPGATIETGDQTSGGVEVVTPGAANPQVFAQLQSLTDESRTSSGIPAQRGGQELPSIISAAGVRAVQGKYSTQIEGYHTIFADMFARANSLALELDEKFLAGDKVIPGSGGERYNPERAINGKYANRVMYGEGSGLDKANNTQLILMLKNAGLIPDSYAMERVTESDPGFLQREMARETLDKAFLLGLATPEVPLHIRAQARKMFEEGKSIPEIAEALATPPEPEAAAPAIPLPGAPREITAEAESLARGGQPGRARRSRAPLPPPEDLFGRAG